MKKGGQKVTKDLLVIYSANPALETVIYSANPALETVPSALRNVRVAFIPKPGKNDYSTPKSFRPKTLSSFILKEMERILENMLKRRPINQRQHPIRV